MSTKIDIRSGLALLALACALAISAAASAAPAAHADELTPPPPPGGAELPTPPEDESSSPSEATPPPPPVVNPTGNPTGTAPEAVSNQAPAPVVKKLAKRPRVLRARLAGRRLKLVLQCPSNGTVSLKGGASQRFHCKGGRAGATLRLPHRLRAHRMRVVIVIHAAESRARVPLTIRRRSASKRARTYLSAPVYWNEVERQCVSFGLGKGGDVQVDTTTYNTFGAAPGEAVYWDAYLYLYYGNAWHRYHHGWESYLASSPSGGGGGNGVSIVGGGGFGTPILQSFRIPARTWAYTGVYAWTRRTGYEWGWVRTNGAGYDTALSGKVAAPNGYCYAY